MKKILIPILAFVLTFVGAQQAISFYYSSKWLDAVMKELDWAKRKIELNEKQNVLWIDGENQFRDLLISMRGGRDKVRAMYEKAAADAENGRDFSWLDDELQGEMKRYVDEHNKVVKKWDAFDQSLSLKQRKIFRDSMSDLVVKDWQHFSGRRIKYLKTQVVIAKRVSEKFIKNPTATDEELMKRYSVEMDAVVSEYEDFNKANAVMVGKLMSNTEIRLADLTDYANDNWSRYWMAFLAIRKSTNEFWNSSSAKEQFAQEKGKLYAAAFRRQREMTPASNN